MSSAKESVPIGLATASVSMQRALDAMLAAASTEAPIMMLAEFGAEVGRLARYVHENSRRHHQPFVSLSCPSLTDLPSAALAKASGGTLFLAEVGELAPELQAKLVHLMEPSAKSSARLISATKHDLVEDVEEKKFRNDLFFRLNVVEIRVPPLRERREDIVPLARGMVASLSAEIGRRVPTFSQDAEAMLLQHSWPGDLLELRNLLEHALLIWPGDVLEPEAFTEIVAADVFHRPRVGDNVTLQALEREHILRIMSRTGDRKDAAAILGIAASTLWRRRRLYDRTHTMENQPVKEE
jgi:NtrC-family two-component system response regulator AlgB